MRCFIALELPDTFIHETAAFAKQLSYSIEGRYVPRTNYHITLAFLGNIHDAEISLAHDALETAASGCEPFILKANSIGKFGRPNNATLWLGVDPDPNLELLAQNVREQLGERGIWFDDKKFKPHITLARHTCIKEQQLPYLVFPEPALVKNVALYKSNLHPSGAEYGALFRVALGK